MRPIIKLPSRTVAVYEGQDALRQLMIEAVGSYCAYCESPITMDFPYAPKISISAEDNTFEMTGKSFTYSVGISPRHFARAWVNQQIICSACANAKGEIPGSYDGFMRLSSLNPGWFNEFANLPAFGRLRLSDDQADDLFIAAYQNWVWPDLATDENGLALFAGDNTFDLFTYEKTSRTQLDLAQNNLVMLTDTEKDQAWASQAQDRVWVIPNQTYIQTLGQDAQEVARRVQNTLLGLNLNYSNPSSPIAADRRVINRTTAFNTIELALGHLNQIVANLQQAGSKGDEDLESPRIATWLSFIRETLRATGFWSLWAQSLLRIINAPDNALWNIYSASARRRLLYQLLIEYEIDMRQFTMTTRQSKDAPIPFADIPDDIGSQAVIAGTDIERLAFLKIADE